jgi:hypothetical protein
VSEFVTDVWRTDWPHPFEHGLIMEAYEPGGDSPMDIHRALTAIDQHMNWLRRDIRESLTRECSGYSELQRDKTTVTYEIPDPKWEEITNALRGTEYVDREFGGRIGITTQRVHRLYAERAFTGNIRAETVLVCSIDHPLG